MEQEGLLYCLFMFKSEQELETEEKDGNYMSKKYFLRDEELHSVDEDFFRHRDVADNISRILDNNNPPYNIAVIGKWGLGKSSLINLVKERLKNDEKNIVVDINAWKYEKEVLGKVFLRKVLEEVDKSRERETQQEKNTKWIKQVFTPALVNNQTKRVK